MDKQYPVICTNKLKYGAPIGSSGQWNGMIGEVLDGVSDFVIADISITSMRASAVAFTMPWMNLGISILYVQGERDKMD